LPLIVAASFAVLIGGAPGSPVMSRTAAPMIGGMLREPLSSMLLPPAAHFLPCSSRLRSVLAHRRQRYA